MTYVIPAPVQHSLPINGSDLRFPVRRIFCIGQNYAAHAIEMGGDPDKAPPFFFEKHPSCLVNGGEKLAFPYPSASNDVHHEIEVVVALKSGGRDLSVEEARAALFGYGVGIDFTRRDLQAEAKKAGRPWATGKSFDHSAPMGPLTEAKDLGDFSKAEIWLDINGKRIQSGAINQMIWPVDEAVAYLSTLFELFAGDVIMTGTPAGVGPVHIGDELVGGVTGLGTLSVMITPQE